MLKLFTKDHNFFISIKSKTKLICNTLHVYLPKLTLHVWITIPVYYKLQIYMIKRTSEDIVHTSNKDIVHTSNFQIISYIFNPKTRGHCQAKPNACYIVSLDVQRNLNLTIPTNKKNRISERYLEIKSTFKCFNKLF